MRPRIAPAALIALVVLSCLNAWLISTMLSSFDLTADETVPTTGKIAQIPTPVAPPFGKTTAGEYRRILEQPVFSKSRAPYVAPPVQPPQATRVAPTPFPAPNLNVTGVMINKVVRKAYVLKPNEPRGIWLIEGDNISGWVVRSIQPTGITIKQNNQSIDIDLYAKQ